jgi:phospholipase C
VIAGVVAVVAALALVPLIAPAQEGAAPASLADAAVTSATAPVGAATPTPNPDVDPNITKLDHIIFIVQENRSFDHYFGTYPGAAGIPKAPGGGFARSTCNWHPVLNKCLKPYHTSNDTQIGGPHEHEASVIDVNGGKMNGFIEGAASGPLTRKCTLQPLLTSCQRFEGPAHQPDVMSFRTRADIPNYWALADYGVLQDRLFASVDSYSLPAHMFIFSGWSATCTGGWQTCKGTVKPASGLSNPPANFNWTPIAYLLDQYNVDWRWYVGEDTNVCANYPKCPQSAGDQFTPTNWNPPPGYTYIRDSHQLDHVAPVSEFRQSLKDDTLPAVSWVIPAEKVSEHPGKGSMKPGYNYVSSLINDIGASSSWGSTAVFLYWDDWGGFYDHMKPQRVDSLGYGIRVPGIMISPYAKPGEIDHQLHSFESFLKLIEDRFLGGERLDPKTLDANWGMKDNRPSVREETDGLGDLLQEFDFTQAPRDPPTLPE